MPPPAPRSRPRRTRKPGGPGPGKARGTPLRSASPRCARPSGARFEPRFTIGLLYLGAFFFLFALLIAAPPLWALWQSLPPGAEHDEQALARAAELARETVRPRLWMALAAALLVTGLGSWTGLLPGTGRRPEPERERSQRKR